MIKRKGNKLIIKNEKIITSNTFMNSNIEEVILEGVEVIEEYAFYGNNIKKLDCPNNLKYIGRYAFSHNKIENINLNEELYMIDDRAFSNNMIKEVKLPSKIYHIGSFVFPNNTNIIYDNKKFDISLINQFDFYGFFKAYKYIMKMIPDFDFNKVNINIILLLCEENNLDKIKSYWYNRKKFDKFYDKLDENFKVLNVQMLFRLSYILGYFNKMDEQNNIENFIRQLYLENDKRIIENFLSNFKYTEYYDNLSKLIKKYYKDDYFISILTEYYNNYNDINKIIRKRNNKNIVEYENIIEYFNNKFDTKHQELKNIISILSGYISKYEFQKIEFLYEHSNKNSVFSFIKGSNNEFEYEWLKGNDPKIFIVGYITNCCARINSVGEDIMIQSIMNPYIKTMVIYYFGKMIGKTTCYYNEKDKYLIFNNIEISNYFMNNLCVGSKEKLEALKTIILGIKKQVKELKNKGYEVNDIRIGMNNNDLADELKECYKISNNNMLSNYHYKNYEGDANSKNGQAIIHEEVKYGKVIRKYKQ